MVDIFTKINLNIRHLFLISLTETMTEFTKVLILKWFKVKYQSAARAIINMLRFKFKPKLSRYFCDSGFIDLCYCQLLKNVK